MMSNVSLTTILFSFLCVVVVQSDATVSMNVDNEVNVYISSDGSNASFNLIGSSTDWQTTLTLTIPEIDITSSTIIKFECIDIGSVGGFIANVNYKSNNYYTTNPIDNIIYEFISSSDGTTSLVYTANGSGAWGTKPSALPANAFWIWNEMLFNTLVFHFKFVSLYEVPPTTTIVPTVNSNLDPTSDPTTDPTLPPTTDPTVDPIADPTMNPTIDPTIHTTMDPTGDPTCDPTQDPTYDPIGNITYEWESSVPFDDKGVMGGGLFIADAYNKVELTITMELNQLKSLNRLRWEYIDWNSNLTNNTYWTVINKEYFNDLNIYTAQVVDAQRLNELGFDSDALVYTSVLTISAIRSLNSGYCYNTTSAPQHILQTGKHYGFRLYVIADSMINDHYDEYFHSDVLNLTTNQFATDGVCILELVDKSSANARLLDDFYFHCTNWVDPDSLTGNFSLKFNGLMNDVLINNALLSKLWTENPQTITGMIGTKALQIKALIRDDLGAITCYQIDIDKSFPSASISDEEILVAIRRIISENDLGKNNTIAVVLDTIIEGLLYINYTNTEILSQVMDLIVVNVVNTSYATNPAQTSSGRVLSELLMMIGLLSEDRLIFSDSVILMIENYLPTLYSTIEQEIMTQPAVALDPSIGDSLKQIALKSFNLVDRLESFMVEKGLNEFEIDHNKVLESFVELSAYSGHIALAQSYPGTTFIHEADAANKKIFTTKIDPNATNTDIFQSCGIQDGNSIQIPPIFSYFYDCSFVDQHDAYFEPNGNYKKVKAEQMNTLSNTASIILYNGDVHNSYFDTRRRRRRRMSVVDNVLDLSTSLLESTEIIDRCAPYWIKMVLNQNDDGLFSKKEQEENTYALGEKTSYPSCTFWNTEDKKWDTNNCFVYNYSNEDVLCACQHLTTFNIKASDFKPRANLISIYHLRDLSNDNLIKYPTVWMALVVVLCLFIFVCVMDAWRGDKDNRSPLSYSDIMFSAVRDVKTQSFLPSTTAHIFEKLYDQKHQHYGVGLVKSIRKDNKLCTNQLKLFKIYLEDNHTLLSVFQHSEGSGYSRRERIASFYLYLTTVMVSSAAFYGVEQQKFGDITASFLISLWSTAPALFVKFSFKKAQPTHTPITINIDGVSQKGLKEIDLSKLPTDVKDNELQEADIERYNEIYIKLEADSKFAFVDQAMMDDVNNIIIRCKHKAFRMAFLDYIRIKLLRQHHSWPHFMKYVACLFVLLWCSMCSFVAITYGIQFDLAYDVAQSSAFAKQGYDEECWDLNPQLVINQELAQQQLLKDAAAINNNFGSHISDSKSWLLQLLQSVIVSILLWQPLTIYLITWLNIWLFSWNLPVSLKPPNLLKLFKNVFGINSDEKEKVQTKDMHMIEMQLNDDIDVNMKHKETDTMDVAKMIESNPEFIHKIGTENGQMGKETKPKKKVMFAEVDNETTQKSAKVRKHAKQRSRSFDLGVMMKEDENQDITAGHKSNTLQIEDAHKRNRKNRGRERSKKGKSVKKRSNSVVSEIQRNKKRKKKNSSSTKAKTKKRTKSVIVESAKKKSNIVVSEIQRKKKRKNSSSTKAKKKKRTKSVIVESHKKRSKSVVSEIQRNNSNEKKKKKNSSSTKAKKKKRTKSVIVESDKKKKTKSKRSKSEFPDDIKRKYKKDNNQNMREKDKTNANRKRSKSVNPPKKKRPQTARASTQRKKKANAKTPKPIKAKAKTMKPRSKQHKSKTPKPQTRKSKSKTARAQTTKSSKTKKDAKKATTPKPKGSKKKELDAEDEKEENEAISSCLDDQNPFSFDLATVSKQVLHETTVRYKTGDDDVIYDNNHETQADKECGATAGALTLDALQQEGINSSYSLWSAMQVSSLSKSTTSISPFSVAVEKSLKSWEDLDEATKELQLNHSDNVYKTIVSHQFRPFDVYAFFGTHRYFLTIVKTWYGLDIAGYEKPEPVHAMQTPDPQHKVLKEEEEYDHETESSQESIERRKSYVRPWQRVDWT